MIAALTLGFMPLCLPAPRALTHENLGSDGDRVHFIDASLEAHARIIGWNVIGGMGRTEAGQRDLVLTVLLDDGTKELRLHDLGDSGPAREPRLTIPIKGDVSAWSVADVRSEPGQELIFLTGKGAWSYSVTHPGYRNNIQSLVATTLLFDIPSPTRLPLWRYRLPHRGELGLHDLVLPQEGGLVRWSPEQEPDGQIVYQARHVLGGDGQAPSYSYVESNESTRRYLNTSDRNGPFAGDMLTFGTMLTSNHGFSAPAVLDIDGDGIKDVLVLGKDELRFHRSGSLEPTRIETLPAYMDPGKARRRLMLEDADGDGDIDLLVIKQARFKALGTDPSVILVLINDGKSLLPESPTQILRFEGIELVAQFADVNGDDRRDLVIRKFELPGITDSLTGLKFHFTHLVHFGNGKAFDRKATVRHEEVYDESDIQAAVGSYDMSLDCSGDGVADLVAINLQGELTLRRVQFKKGGFFSADTWALEPAPWKVFPTGSLYGLLKVIDLNRDGIGDLIAQREEGLTIQISKRRGQRP